MVDIYDVLKLLVTRGRGVLTDAEIAVATGIIERHQAAAPVPAEVKEDQGDAEAHA